MAFTFFFRDSEVLELAVQHVAPELTGRSCPRIWDAGCAMGPEAYTLAILLAGRLGPFGFRNLRIEATDLDESGRFEQTVSQAVYADRDLERMPPGILDEYFVPADAHGSYRVIDSVRSRVQFQRHDLLSFREIGASFSMVVCKNVLLHFSESQRIDVIRMFHRALGTGGYFVTEQTQKLPPDAALLFEQVVPHGQLFRKVEVESCSEF